MVKEDVLLREEMGRLEIEPIKLNRSRSDLNPFVKNSKRIFSNRAPLQSASCPCTSSKKNTNNGICKKKHNKILKEPVLQIIKTEVIHKNGDKEVCQHDAVAAQNIIDPLSLCTLVKTCNQLKISNDNDQNKSRDVNDKTKWWKNEVVCPREDREQRPSNQGNQAGSCSQQALNPPCDITIDELASYFETLVHIPKKMSSMAEMMYI